MCDMIINDFQFVNIEFLEFWMLSFFLDEFGQGVVFDVDVKQGDFYINLGNILEDIFWDLCLFYENGFFGLINFSCLINDMEWLWVLVFQQIIWGFDIDEVIWEQQDVGLDGLSDVVEWIKYQDYIEVILVINLVVGQQVVEDFLQDNFWYYNDG